LSRSRRRNRSGPRTDVVVAACQRVAADDTLTNQIVRDLIEDSYDLVLRALPTRVRERLGWLCKPTNPPHPLGAAHSA